MTLGQWHVYGMQCNGLITAAEIALQTDTYKETEELKRLEENAAKFTVTRFQASIRRVMDNSP